MKYAGTNASSSRVAVRRSERDTETSSCIRMRWVQVVRSLAPPPSTVSSTVQTWTKSSFWMSGTARSDEYATATRFPSAVTIPFAPR